MKSSIFFTITSIERSRCLAVILDMTSHLLFLQTFLLFSSSHSSSHCKTIEMTLRFSYHRIRNSRTRRTEGYRRSRKVPSSSQLTKPRPREGCRTGCRIWLPITAAARCRIVPLPGIGASIRDRQACSPSWFVRPRRPIRPSPCLATWCVLAPMTLCRQCVTPTARGRQVSARTVGSDGAVRP